MRKKFVITLVAGALLLGAAGIAQELGERRGRGFGKHGGPGMGRMAEELNLSDQQKEQLRAMHESQRQQMQALRSDTSLTPEQRRERALQLRQQAHNQFQGILTPEQKQQLESQRQQRQARGLDRMAKALNLTEQQKQQAQPIFEAQRQQMEALRNDTSLSAEQKRERAMQLREQTQSQLQNILTPEQQQQAEKMREHMQQRRHRGGGPGGPGGQFF